VEQLVACRAHNPKVAGSNPASATKTLEAGGFQGFYTFRFIHVAINVYGEHERECVKLRKHERGGFEMGDKSPKKREKKKKSVGKVNVQPSIVTEPSSVKKAPK
jgi:CxxC-x17-CxxC domain-containing protein